MVDIRKSIQILLFCCGATQSSVWAEVLLDLGFEQDAAARSAMPATGIDDQFIHVDHSSSKQGQSSLRVDVPRGQSVAFVSETFHVDSNQDCLLSFWFRAGSRLNANTGPNLITTVIWLDRDQRHIGQNKGHIRTASDDGWHLATRMLRSPAGAAMAQIQLAFQPANESPLRVWIDMLRVRAMQFSNASDHKVLTRIYVADGGFNQGLFRRVADDEAQSGYSVIANPRYAAQPGYLAANSYIRNVQPGYYRAIYRVKMALGERVERQSLVWDINSDASGELAAGEVGFPEQGPVLGYRDFEARFIVPPGVTWIDPRIFWSGGVKAWVDTITIIQDDQMSEAEVRRLFE